MYGSKIGLNRLANIDPDTADSAWSALLSPDDNSSDKMRAPENEGRRIEAVPGGFKLLNFEYYRGLRNDDDRREQNRAAQAKFKAKVSQGKPKKAEVIPSEAEAEAEAETDAVRTEDAKRPSCSTSRFVKPTREELDLHAAKIGLAPSEVDKFVNHYESNGWKVGRNPMRSWSHALVNWKLNQQTYETHQRNSGQRPAIDRNAGTLNAGKASEYANVGKCLPVSDPQRRDA